MSLRSRFKDAPWFSGGEEVSCIVGGAGGIGSWLTFLLSRAGYSPAVYDFDIVEIHNIGGQLYSKKDVGLKKVEALQRFLVDYADEDITIFDEKYIEGSMTSEFVFAGFDNMQARKDMFKNWITENKDNPRAIFIDGRLSMEQIQILCVTPSNAEEYEREYLFDDSEVEDAPCTMKQTSHTAAMIAGLMVGFFTNHITNIKEGKVVRQVPLFYEYFIPLNMVS